MKYIEPARERRCVSLKTLLAAELFSKLPGDKQDIIIKRIEDILSEQPESITNAGDTFEFPIAM